MAPDIIAPTDSNHLANQRRKKTSKELVLFLMTILHQSPQFNSIVKYIDTYW